jgi:hypothetical protein
MNIMIVFPEQPEGVPPHFKCGKDYVYLRSAEAGLKSLAIDTLVIMPGCSEEQKRLALDRTKSVRNPKVLRLEKPE